MCFHVSVGIGADCVFSRQHLIPDLTIDQRRLVYLTVSSCEVVLATAAAAAAREKCINI